MKKNNVVPILFLAISSALCAERNLECSSFEKNTTVMSDDVIRSLSKVVDDSLYTRWNAKNFIHNSFIACTCLCENKYSIQSRNNRKFYWVFNYCDSPDTVVTLEADSDNMGYFVLKKSEKLYLMIEKLKDEIDRYDSLLCDSATAFRYGRFKDSAEFFNSKRR